MNGPLGLLLALALIAVAIMYVWGMQIANSPEIDTQTGTSTTPYDREAADLEARFDSDAAELERELQQIDAEFEASNGSY
jgi:hypothetical protein